MKIKIEIDTNEPAGDIPALVSEVLAAAAEVSREGAADDALKTIVNASEDAGLSVIRLDGNLVKTGHPEVYNACLRELVTRKFVLWDEPEVDEQEKSVDAKQAPPTLRLL
jgi:hypothetical protein